MIIIIIIDEDDRMPWALREEDHHACPRQSHAASATGYIYQVMIK
jgi:hypothetical protein